MPLYEYTCESCGHGFERRLKFDERLTLQTCPACGHEGASLRLSAPAALRSAAGSPEPRPACPSTGNPCGCMPASLN